MKIKERIDYDRRLICNCCGLEFDESEFTSEDEYGNDLCPACGETDFEEVPINLKNDKAEKLIGYIIDHYSTTKG